MEGVELDLIVFNPENIYGLRIYRFLSKMFFFINWSINFVSVFNNI